MSFRAQPTILARTSLSRKSGLLLALADLHIGPARLALDSVGQAQVPRMAGCGGRWSVENGVVHPLSAFVSGAGSHRKDRQYGPPAVRLRWRPVRRASSEGVSIERHLSRIFPAFPRSLASVLIPRPAARRGSASAYAALRVSAFKKSFRLFPQRARKEKIFRTFRKSAAWPWERGTLASLRARVSRGNFGQIQTGEKQWHSTKTKSS
jgi:hypothetical protein